MNTYLLYLTLKYPLLPKEDVRLICLCSMVFALVLSIVLLIKHCSKERVVDNVISPTELAVLKQLRQQVNTDSAINAQKYASPHLADSLFAFDPNHADSATLLKLGLSHWQVSNMMKYRSKGGIWRSPNDFKRLYGLSEKDFKRLKPFVRIADKDRKGKFIPFSITEFSNNHKAEKPKYEKIEKLKEGDFLNLQSADTTDLKKIPGIGSYYASKIVRYREHLGGFVSIDQLNEIDGLPPNISSWFTLGNQKGIKRIRINHATFNELIRHPYINYEQTKDIVNHIRQYGKLHSLKELRLYKEFSDKDFARLEPYITFD